MPTLLQLKDRSRYKPAYLLELTLKNSGPTLYLSDRNISIEGQIYEDYLDDLTGIGDELRRADSEGLNTDITLTFKNDKYKGYNYLIEIGDTYPFEGAVCVIKETALDDSGTPSVPETVFKGVLDEPEDIDLMGFKCKVSSMVFHADRSWKQEVIDTTVYPNALEDVGKVEPLIYGGSYGDGTSFMSVPCLRIDWGAKSTLITEITHSENIYYIEVSDASRFPASGSVWIDDEKITYTQKESNKYLCGNSSCSAGGGASLIRSGTVTPHKPGAVVWEHKTYYDSLIACHELKNTGAVLAEIDGKLHHVEYGVSAVFEGGKHKLRATSQIKIQRVKDNTVETVSGSNKKVYPSSMAGTFNNPSAAMDGSEVTYADNGSTTGKTLIPSFSSTSYGAISKQYIYVCYETWLYAEADRLSVSSGWSISEIMPSSSKTTVRLEKTGGAWSDGCTLTTVAAGTTTWYVREIWKEVEYNAIVSKTGDVIGTREVDRFHCGAGYYTGASGFVYGLRGYKDPDGNYGGIGNLIERPDYIIKHFIVHKMGFSLSDIDTTSFNTAGSFYATSYPFAFVINEKIKPSEFLRRLAFECRSTIKYIAGKWYLDVIPDTAPSALRAITKSELAGTKAKFIFNKTDIGDLQNDLTVKFKKAYSRLGSESEWDGTAKTSDSASITKYGTYPKEFEFEAIRLQAMADNVLAHILKQRKQPYLVVTFTVFWDHFDLKVGDTIEVDNPLYDGKKFYIEKISRLDKFRANVKAIEWW